MPKAFAVFISALSLLYAVGVLQGSEPPVWATVGDQLVISLLACMWAWRV